MSHFREDNDGFLADPTQKTLFSFFGPGDGRKVKTDDNASLGFDEETGLPLDRHELCCDPTDKSDTNQILDHSSCTSSKYCGEMEDIDRLRSSESKVKVSKILIIHRIDRGYF